MQNNKSKAIDGINYSFSFLGALGVGIQNYLGSMQFVQSFMDKAYSLSQAGLGIAHGFGGVLGGPASLFVNFLLNVELIRDFITRCRRLRDRSRIRAMQRHYDQQVKNLEQLKRQANLNAEQCKFFVDRNQDLLDEINKKKREVAEYTSSSDTKGEYTDGLTGLTKILCWIGISFFIISGLLYGLMAVAVAPEGALAILGIVAGALVTPIQTIQEIEVWVNYLDPLQKQAPGNVSKLAKGTGLAFSFLTVVVLSTLFTAGIASFLMGFGVAALPAVIAGASIAFSIGAFTEFFFYAPYLMDFCGNVSKTVQDFKQSKKPLAGLLIVGFNAVANGVMAYFAIGLLVSFIVAAGAAVPPLGGILAVAVLAGVIAAAASFMLGTKFWVRKFGADKKADLVPENESLLGGGEQAPIPVTPRKNSFGAGQSPRGVRLFAQLPKSGDLEEVPESKASCGNN